MPRQMSIPDVTRTRADTGGSAIRAVSPRMENPSNSDLKSDLKSTKLVRTTFPSLGVAGNSLLGLGREGQGKAIEMLIHFVVNSRLKGRPSLLLKRYQATLTLTRDCFQYWFK
eukprot:1392407-Amorphochlora_amoeboformis.AAC.2